MSYVTNHTTITTNRAVVRSALYKNLVKSSENELRKWKIKTRAATELVAWQTKRHESEIKRLCSDKNKEIQELKLNEESHSAHIERMMSQMQEMRETNESLTFQMVKEMADLKKNQEHELSQLTNRFNNLEARNEELQLENLRHHQVETELNQTINHLKADKEKAKEFWEVLQKQNDELTRQLEKESGKVAKLQEKITKNEESRDRMKTLRKRNQLGSRQRTTEQQTEESSFA